MNPVRYIRKSVFGMTQAAFAGALGVSQPTTARWERDGRFPSEHQAEIRRLGSDICQQRGIQWEDRWFFEAPGLDEAA